MKDSETKKMAMISAVGEVLRMRKEKGNNITHEEMMRELARFIRGGQDNNVKVLMVAAASKALDIIHKDSGARDKDVMRIMVGEFDYLIQRVDTEA